MNEHDKEQRRSTAMIDEHFEKIALFGLGKKNKSNPIKTKETWIDGVDVEDYDKHVNTAKSVYSKAKANNHLTQSGLNALEQSNAEGSTPFQWIGSRDFTDGNADTYINEYRSLMNKSACDIVEESFDKVAFNLGAVAKTVGNGIKSMATATKNLPNSIGNVKKLHNFATNTNLSQSTRSVAATARNKQIGNVAKGMALPAMGVVGAGMIGAGINNALHNNNEKTAFDIVNDSFEKVALDVRDGKIVMDNQALYEIIDVNPDLIGTPGEYDTWKNVDADLADFLNNHARKEEFIQDHAFNKERDKIVHPKAGRAKLKKVLGGVALSAGLSAMTRNTPQAFLADSALGAAAGLMGGVAKAHRMNEELRDEKMGPARFDAQNAIFDDLYDEFNGKRYGYDGAYAHMLAAKKRSEALNNRTASDIIDGSFDKVAGTYYDFNAYKKRVNSKNVGSEKDYKSGFEYNKNYIFNNMLSDYMYGEHENEPVAEYLRNSTQGKPIGDGHMSNLMNRRQAKKMIKGYNKVRANAKVTDDNKEYLEQSDEFIKALGSARKDGNKRFVYTLG